MSISKSKKITLIAVIAALSIIMVSVILTLALTSNGNTASTDTDLTSATPTAPHETTPALDTTAPVTPPPETTAPDTTVHIHVFGDWVSVRQANCIVAGEKMRECACGARQTEPLPRTAHTEVIVSQKDATCTQSGSTGETKCSVCRITLKAAAEIAPLGHEETTVAGKAPTCLSSGTSDSVVCSRCDLTIAFPQVLPPAGHTETVISGKAPTCTSGGLSDSVICTVCRIELSPPTALAPLGHIQTVTQGKSPSCTESGYTNSSFCTRCSTTVEPLLELPALGHAFVSNICVRCSIHKIETLNVSSPNFGLYDASTLAAIYEENALEQIDLASITKLVTASVALKYISPDTVITVGSEILMINEGSSTARLSQGQSLKFKDLLAALLLASGNDAAYTVAVNAARAASGNPNMSDEDAVKYFLVLMNSFAADIGATSSNFVNPDGWNDEGHLTTVRDLSLISAYALNDSIISQIVSKQKITVTFVSGGSRTWENTNYLLNPATPYYLPNAIGLKTGSTSTAGKCLASAVVVNGKTYIAIVMGCTTDTERYEATLELLKLLEGL